jgi:predicted  nucleic acid-binding Zn-ribbon protein
MLLRIIIIAISAYMTAQPVEVIAFGGRIQNRIHEESIRIEAVSLLRDLKKAETESRGATGLEGTVEKESYDKAEDTLSSVQEEEGKLNAELGRAKRAEQAAAANLQRAQAAYNASRNKAAAANRISVARSRLESARQDVANVEGRLQALAVKVTGAKDEKSGAEAKVIGRQKLAEGSIERIRNWLKILRSSIPGDPVSEGNNRPDSFKFRDQEYDFFQRLSVIDDLYHGRPPRWKDASDSDKSEISKSFGFGESEEERQRGAIEAVTFVKWYWAVFLWAFLLPLFVLAYKLLFTKDLINYYSRDMQAGTGLFK